MVRKYFIEILLFVLLIALATVFVLNRSHKAKPANNNDSFVEPSISTTVNDTKYLLRVSFSEPSQLYNKILLLKVICRDGEKDLGSFTVKDIRLWNLDGTRIINNEFTLQTKPEHLIVIDKTNIDERILFEGDISKKTVLESQDDSVDSFIKIDSLVR